MRKLGIKGKINLGFLVLFFLLTLSGAISVFELARMRSSVSGVLIKNVSNLALSRHLLDVEFRISYGMQELVEGHDEAARWQLAQADSLSVMLRVELAAEDSVALQLRSISLLLQRMRNDVNDAFLLTREERYRLYFDRFLPASRVIVNQTEDVMRQNRDALSANAKLVEDSRYRSIVPDIIAVFAGLMLILLFNYFINYFFVNPLIKITRSVESTVEFGAPFKPSVASGDEIGELKEAISQLAQQAKKTARVEAEAKSFNDKDKKV